MKASIAKASMFGTALFLAASPAQAQWQGARSDGDRRGGDMGYRSNEGGWRGSARDDREGEGWGSRRERIGSGQGGPSIRLRSNGVEITVRCGEEDSIRSCVDAASTLIDRASALRTTSRSGAGDATPDSQSVAPKQP